MFVKRFFVIFGFAAIACFFFSHFALAATAKVPMTVNGDVVEFKSAGREVVAEGNVEIVYQSSKMTCDKVRVFIDEKLAIAEGHVCFFRAEGEEFEGDLVILDFNNRTGTITGPVISMMPYYGKAEVMDRISDDEFSLFNAEMSTCDLPHPHWGLKCKSVKMDPGRVLTAKGIKLNVLGVPLLYVPSYTQVMTDKRPRLMIIPGYKKEFGKELFGSWRYYLNANAKGLLHLDWYEKTGWAEGVDLNYNTRSFGIGNAKYYRIDEKNTRDDIDASVKKDGERSRIELRHRWNMTESDNLVVDYFRSSDPDFRKDYFLREYTKEPDPKSFFQYSHVYPNATLSFLAEPRVNDYSSMLEKVPEIKLETINQKILDTPFYFKDTTVSSYMMNAAANESPSGHVGRVDTTNQFSYLFRMMGVDLSPFAGYENTLYSRGIDGKESLARGMFFTGMDASLRLFKIYEVNTNFMHLNISKLRHIVTPSFQYRYQLEPTINSSRLQQFDAIDALGQQNSFVFSLENKLQTKRDGNSVDLATLIMSTPYLLDAGTGAQKGFGNFTIKLEANPYSWCGFESDTLFNKNDQDFATISNSLWMDIGRLKTNFGYEYKKEVSSQLTLGASYPLNPFWKVGIYERIEYKTGNLVEQEYTLERDMHCWVAQFIINQREVEGLTVLLAFKLKGFPEIAVGAEKTFTPPRTTEE